MNNWIYNLNPSSGWASQEKTAGKRAGGRTSGNAFFWEFARGNESTERDWGSERIRMCSVMNIRVRGIFNSRLERMKNE